MNLLSKKTILNHSISIPQYDNNISDKYLSMQLSKIFAVTFARRNIEYTDEILQPRLSKILQNSDVCFIPDSKEFIEYLHSAIKNQVCICIFGDYDVDGITSTSVLAELCESQDANFFIENSDRSYGYGINNDVIDKIHKKGCKLLVLLDCGTSLSQEIEYAKSKEIKVAVIDHHKLPDIPAKPDFFINPHQYEEDSMELKSLSACGLIYFISYSYRSLFKIDQSIKSLILCLFSTISDIVPLSKINRALINFAMLQIKKSNKIPYFLQVFLDKSCKSKDNLHIDDISFLIGPMVNAPGRLGSIDISLRAINANSYNEASQCYDKLIEINNKRKAMEKDIISKIELSYKRNDNIFFAYEYEILGGISGIIASRMQEVTGLPSFIMSTSDGQIYSGSSRAKYGDLSYIINQACNEGILIKGGGHKFAAGFSLNVENIQKFKEYLISYYKDLNDSSIRKIDYEVYAYDEIDMLYYRDQERMKPFGHMFHKPMILFHECTILSMKEYRSKGFEITFNFNNSKEVIQAKNFTFFNNHRETIKKAFNLKEKIHIIGKIDDINSKYSNFKKSIKIDDIIL